MDYDCKKMVTIGEYVCVCAGRVDESLGPSSKGPMNKKSRTRTVLCSKMVRDSTVQLIEHSVGV